jgi:predicted methyltransferase
MNKSFGKALRCLGAMAVLLAGLSLPSLTAAQSATKPAERKSSTPYTGDLSIFDSPGRDERLQINRVMDLLNIKPGRNVADIGAGSGWFTVRAARRLAISGTVLLWTSTPKRLTTLNSVRRMSNSTT